MESSTESSKDLMSGHMCVCAREELSQFKGGCCEVVFKGLRRRCDKILSTLAHSLLSGDNSDASWRKYVKY